MKKKKVQITFQRLKYHCLDLLLSTSHPRLNDEDFLMAYLKVPTRVNKLSLSNEERNHLTSCLTAIQSLSIKLSNL